MCRDEIPVILQEELDQFFRKNSHPSKAICLSGWSDHDLQTAYWESAQLRQILPLVVTALSRGFVREDYTNQSFARAGMTLRKKEGVLDIRPPITWDEALFKLVEGFYGLSFWMILSIKLTRANWDVVFQVVLKWRYTLPER